jgi:Uma2 family endonuclease
MQIQQFKYPAEQCEPPLPARETLPTMYDLPSENPEEPGLPDEFHDLQPELLRFTFRPPNYPAEQVFCGSDINLYYDPRHHYWYKRPDWFAVVGVSRLYENQDLRLSYVMWQEAVRPTVVVELLSPGTEKEDLGLTVRLSSEPPTKWDVYEQILGVPYYIVFDRYTDELKAFVLTAGSYRQIELQEPKIWMPQLELGLGLWSGTYEGITRTWLRWYDAQGNWILTPSEREAVVEEQLKLEREQLQAERSRSERLAELLRAQGIDPDSIT